MYPEHIVERALLAYASQKARKKGSNGIDFSSKVKNRIKIKSILMALCPACDQGDVLDGMISICPRCSVCDYDFYPEPGFYLVAAAKLGPKVNKTFGV